ncbi:MAG: gamma-glutamyltransferase [Gaiellales bacterium]
MRGAIAAGSRQAAEAGAWALTEGGTAVDAAVAAVLAAFVSEGPLTGPAGGGFVMFEEAGGVVTSLDCFFAVPAAPPGVMDEVVIDFGDASTQVFHVGPASVATPGLVQGLAVAHARGGRLAWHSLARPAIELARRGFQTTPEQAFLIEILVPILQRQAEGRHIYGAPGSVCTDRLVPALELIADAGADAIPELFPDLNGDLERYEVIDREPVSVEFAGATVLATPEPSVGGKVVRAALEVLERAGRDSALGSAEEAVALARALAAGYGDAAAATGGVKPTGTTNVSVVDVDGAVAVISSTLGSGSGVFTHGFQLNNMLGELDVIGTLPREPYARLPSMMTPTVAVNDGRPRLVVGSAGSVRLSGAIVQVVAATIGRGLSVGEAIDRPRVHVDGRLVHVEGGWAAEVAAALEADGWEVVRWADRNLFFGGTSAVELLASGELRAAGDPRRGGVGLVVS